MSTESGRRQLAGGEPPKKRLAITPTSRKGRIRRPAGSFPWIAPTWPGTVTRPPDPPELGVAYDTGWARRYPARLARVLLTDLVTRPLMRAVAAPQVEGLDRIAHLEGPVIFAANHTSHIDTPLLLSVLPERWRHRTVVAGAADYFFDTRWKAATFALTINAIPIERLRVSRSSANRAAALLDEGWSLLIYPEGGRSPDGWSQTHRAGAAWLSVRTARPIIPIHVAGTGQILARHSNRLRPGTTTVTFGRPLRPEAGGDPRRLAERLEHVVEALADERTTDWWTATKRAARKTTPSLSGPSGAAWRRAWALDRRSLSDRRPGRYRRWPEK